MAGIIVSRGDFNGYEMLVAKDGEDDQYPAQVGKKKAGLFLQNLPQISDFIEANPDDNGSTTLEIENGKFPWTLRLSNARKLIQITDEIGKFAAE